MFARFRSIVFVASFAFGCAPDPDFVGAPETDWPFFIVVEGSGRAPEASGPHRWEEAEGVFRFGVDGVDRIHLLSVDLDAVLGPRLGDSAYTLDRLEIHFEDEPCADGRAMGEGLRRPLIAEQARLYELVGERFEARALADFPASLWAPSDDPACFTAPPPSLAPFGPESQLYPTGESGPLVRGNNVGLLHPLSDGRVLVGTRGSVFVAHPGRAGPTEPAAVWSVEASPPLRDDGGSWMLRAFAAVESSSVAGPLRVGVLLSWLASDGPAGEEVVLDLSYSGAEFGQAVPRLGPLGGLRFINAAPSGVWVVGGTRGQLYRRRDGQRDYQRVDLTGTPLESVELREWLPDWTEAEPDLLVDVVSGMYFGDLDRPSSFRVEHAVGGFEPPLSRVGESEGAMHLYWSAGSPEFQHRAPDGRREVLVGYLPHAFEACADPPDVCGRLSFAPGMRSYLVAAPSGTLILGSTSCSALVEVEPELGCARAVVDPVGSIDLVSRQISALAGSEDAFFVGGQGLTLLRASWQR